MSHAETTQLTPREFVKSQRTALVIGSVVFAAIMLTAVFSVDPAYNYPRLITDQLLYYMKALSFVNDGTTAARAAVNAPPFTYAATPGLLRAPLIAAFGDFDDQLRAIQVSNIALGIILGALSAYILSWAVPQRFHWVGVAFSFATLVLNPVWVTNVLSPLADLPYAVASLGALVALNRMIRGTESERRSRVLKLVFVLLFAVAFGCRYTAPVLLVYGWILFRQKRDPRGANALALRRAFIAVGIVLAILVAIDFRTIVFGYLWQPYQFLIHDSMSALLLNTLALGIPSQVIPGLDQLYRAPPLDQFHPVFASNPLDFGLTMLGLLITSVVAYGMWLGRERFKAERFYVLLPLPVLAAIIPSTARYLLSYQPFIWLFLYLGAAHLAALVIPRVKRRAAITAAAVVFCCVSAATVLYIRASRVTGAERITLSSFSLGESRGHASEVTSTFRSLREFLESLPHGRSLVIGDRASTGQWKVIAGIDYYELDDALAKMARVRDLYVVMSCPSKVLCSGFDRAIKKREERLLGYGAFEFDSVFAERNEHSAAIVYRVRAGN